ncbi:MAG: hypothetical protein RMM53_14010, partial [Bacteroidia bacterium]|nr:hypothetical protein [Bacteroidia bacterium]
AIEKARKENAVLIAGRLNVIATTEKVFQSFLKKKIDFVVCDVRNNDVLFTPGFFREYRRDLVSERVRKALEIKKLQGVRLGAKGRENLALARQKSYEVLKEKALSNPNSVKAWKFTRNMLLRGYNFYQIAKMLQDKKYLTPRNKKVWRTRQVILLYETFVKLESQEHELRNLRRNKKSPSV